MWRVLPTQAASRTLRRASRCSLIILCIIIYLSSYCPYWLHWIRFWVRAEPLLGNNWTVRATVRADQPRRRPGMKTGTLSTAQPPGRGTFFRLRHCRSFCQQPLSVIRLRGNIDGTMDLIGLAPPSLFPSPLAASIVAPVALLVRRGLSIRYTSLRTGKKSDA